MSERYKLNIYGASHAESVGMTLSGIPAGQNVDVAALQSFCDRRKASNSVFSTSRAEQDKLIILSGIENGVTTGDTIKIEIKNRVMNRADYDYLSDTPRPSHSDYVAKMKYGDDYDTSGGGKFSGRMTAAICMAGGIAKQLLEKEGVIVGAYVAEIAGVSAANYFDTEITAEKLKAAANKPLPLLDDNSAEKMLSKISEAKAAGDSVGGVVEGVILGLPIGVGDCLFDGLESEIAKSLFGIPAVKGVEFGAGFGFSEMRGSEANDPFKWDNGIVKTTTNFSGGINGGISNGMPVMVRVAFRPTPSIAKPQHTVNLRTKEDAVIQIVGRHDACIVPRAVAAVEAALAIAILNVKGI